MRKVERSDLSESVRTLREFVALVDSEELGIGWVHTEDYEYQGLSRDLDALLDSFSRAVPAVLDALERQTEALRKIRGRASTNFIFDIANAALAGEEARDA